MADIPSLAEVLAEHVWRGGILGCQCGWDWPEERTYACGEDERITAAHIAHVADAWQEACTIRTAEQLESLPVGAAVLDLEVADVFHAVSRPAPQVPAWVQPGHAYRAMADEVPLPALLIWQPRWTS